MSIQEVPRVLPNSLKDWGVCFHIYVAGAYKEHVWFIGTCPTTILLSAMSECTNEYCILKGQMKRVTASYEVVGLYAPQGVDLGGGLPLKKK